MLSRPGRGLRRPRGLRVRDGVGADRMPFHVREAHGAMPTQACGLSWTHWGYKCCAFLYLCFMAWLAWLVLPFPGHWSTHKEIVPAHADMANYFSSFKGNNECNAHVEDLYIDPRSPSNHGQSLRPFCKTRAALLESMSDGGRIGFDAPYYPRGCAYGWFGVEQICMILDRFDGLIFFGDESLQPIYSAFNSLLRQDLVHGSLLTWDMDSQALSECRCDIQFTKTSCVERAITSSDQLPKQAHHNHKPAYFCNRIPHGFLRTGSSPPSDEVLTRFKVLAPKAPLSRYKHIPIIYSLSPATTSIHSATESLLAILKLADDTGRKTDMLFIGPTAAGHTYIKGRKNNQEIWDFHQALAKVAKENDIDVLGMWNLTVQASSWDGLRFGQKVAITQAMMVVNWLARLETS